MAATDYTDRATARIVAQIPDGDTSRDSLIDYLIPHVSRYIDKHCHRVFYPKTRTEVYDYQSDHRLWLRGDLNSLTSIVNGDTQTIDLTKVFKYPLGGPPYQWLDINQSSTVVFRWASTTDKQCIQVTGVWGYLEDDETPAAIQDACAAWIKYLLLVSQKAGIRSTTIGDYSVSYSNFLEYLRNGPPNEVAFDLSFFIKRRFGTISKVTAP